MVRRGRSWWQVAGSIRRRNKLPRRQCAFAICTSSNGWRSPFAHVCLWPDAADLRIAASRQLSGVDRSRWQPLTHFRRTQCEDTAAGAAFLHRQSRLCAVEGLDLAFLIDAQHQRLVRRVEIQPNDILNFFGELRIVRQLEGLRQVWFEPMRCPDALHAGMAEACRQCQLARPTNACPPAASREASYEPRARSSPPPEASCGQGGLHRAADLRYLVQHSDHASDTPCVWSCQSPEQSS